MDYYVVLLPLGIILVVSKLLSKFCRKVNLPQVIGMLLAGVLIGVLNYIPTVGEFVLSPTAVTGLGFFAKIGVILIMFAAGLDIDIKQIRVIGVPAVLITLAGVAVPMALGFGVAQLCMPQNGIAANLFYGSILTATSVSVTVATLQELGRLNSKVGSTVVAAAILDDIIGIIVLSVVSSLGGTSSAGQSDVLWVLIKTVLFFIAAIVVGLGASRLFTWIEKKFPHHRLLPILSVALCFLFAYGSEMIFGIADITGAFVAGLVLSVNPEHSYIERRSDIMSYMIFTPVFFANIGITTQITSIDSGMIWFGLLFIVVGLVGKVIGCGGTALLCRYGLKDSFRVGIGMMARAEVALVCAQKGVEIGMISSSIMPFIVVLIILSSFVTPILMRVSYKKDLAAPKLTASKK